MIKINGILIEQNHFPDGTLLTKFDPYSENFNWEDGICIDWHYHDDAELFTIICLKKHLDHFFDSTTTINLNMPYVPHARMDRVKHSEEIFTLKYFCDVINSLHFDIVFVQDVHSNVALALLNNVVELKVTSTIERVIDMCGDPVLFYPDEGAMKRYSFYIDAPNAFGIKNRDWSTGKINGLTLINGDLVKGRDVLIIDDICSRGGTFYHSAKALKEAGANKIYLYVTHCETSIFDGELINSGLISRIYTTDSIFPVERQKDIIKIVR